MYNPSISSYEFDLQRFVVNGSGWPPGVPISIDLAIIRPGGEDEPVFVQQAGTITAQPDGSFLGNFAKPFQVPANLYVVATSRGYQARTPYTAGATQ
jgi:hypothetical protein